MVHHIGHRLAPVWMGIKSPETVCREIVSEVDRMLNRVAETAIAGLAESKGGEICEVDAGTVAKRTEKVQDALTR